MAGDEPLDVPAFRRLALRVTSTIGDASTAAFTHETLCAAIDAHAVNPEEARDRIELLRPTIKILSARQ